MPEHFAESLKDSNPMWNESIALALPKKFENVPAEDIGMCIIYQGLRQYCASPTLTRDLRKNLLLRVPSQRTSS